MQNRFIEILVDEHLSAKRLDVLLGECDALPSRSACAKLIQDGCVQVNDKSFFSKKEKLNVGDHVKVQLPVLNETQPLKELEREVPIVYEDNDVIVLSKPAGLVVHPAQGHEQDTLCNVLIHKYGLEHLGVLQGTERPGIVHRLDMNTSGLMFAAHTTAVQQQLQELIQNHTLDRRYITLVQGKIQKDEGVIHTYIGRSKKNRLRMCVTSSDTGKEALTTFKTIARLYNPPTRSWYSLLECRLHTGRTHQIRVHMRHIGHPVVGDQQYGQGSEAQNLQLHRQFLHSWYVHFTHPVTHQDIILRDELSHDLYAVLECLINTKSEFTLYAPDVLSHLKLFE